MRIDILTLFPEICQGAFGASILKRAVEAGVADLRVHNIRDWASDKHKMTDDLPYGGGAGMVMKPEPIFAAVEELKADDSKVFLMSPRGRKFSQQQARELSHQRHLILISGHYEGVDERVCKHLIDGEISIGDYVLTNGAIAAVVVADAIIRLLPGALGNEESALHESFSHGRLEHPHYTRPADFRGWKVPEVLLSGNHAEIERWRNEQSQPVVNENKSSQDQ